MKMEFDALENQLSNLRPARLPATARQRILHEMQRPAARHGALSRLLGHHAGFPVALAGALSVVVAVGLYWLPRPPHPAAFVDQPTLAASNALLPSLFLEAKLAVAPPIGENTVVALCSPSMLTNIQTRR